MAASEQLPTDKHVAALPKLIAACKAFMKWHEEYWDTCGPWGEYNVYADDLEGIEELTAVVSDALKEAGEQQETEE